MIINLIIFLISILLVIRGSSISAKYAALLAERFHLSKYTVGFIIVAVISILPETFIALNSAVEGIPTFGLGVLFGSNVADLTLIFAIIILFAGRGIRIETKILKNQKIFPFLLLLPLVLGIDGNFSRVEGIALIITGAIFYYLSLRGEMADKIPIDQNGNKIKNLIMFIFGMIILLLGAHFVVTSASSLANNIGVSPIIIGMMVVGLGTTIPELLFSLKSVKKEDDSLAVGDLLGTVVADATIVVGILSLVSPFSFPVRIIYTTGLFMVIASIILFYFMKSGKIISRKEGILLLFFWIIFVLIEFLINT